MRSGSAETFPGSNLAAVMLESTLGLIDAVFCCGLALAVLLLRPRALSQWSFVAGMIALGAESALNALTRVLSEEEGARGILVNSMCPGWVRTDMGGSAAPRSVEEGADTAVWLATLPPDGPTGGFFRDRKPIPW